MTTKPDVQDMDAAAIQRELATAIGWTMLRDNGSDRRLFGISPPNDCMFGPVPNWPTDPAAAHQLRELVKATTQFVITQMYLPGRKYETCYLSEVNRRQNGNIRGQVAWHATGETPMLAFCRAVVLAIRAGALNLMEETDAT